MTKIALITNIPTPYRVPLYEKLAEKIDLTVYFTNVSKSDEKFKINDKRREWEISGNYKFKFKFLPGFTIYGPSGINYDVNPSIFKELRKNKYDIVILGGYNTFTTQITFLLCKLKQIPLIMWASSTKNENTMARKLSKPLIKFIVRNCGGFVAYGTKAKEYMVSMGVDENNIFIATNVGNVDFFMRESEKNRSKRDIIANKLKINTKFNILYVGALSERKGTKYLIEAYKRFKQSNQEWGLILVGNGPEKEALLSSSENVADIHFVEFVQPEFLPNYYSIADIFVIPTSSDPFSIVVSEAMASELPVISTFANGASTDLIFENYNGLVIPDKNTEEIYNALKKISENPEKIRLMGKNSKKIIQECYNLNNMVQSFLKAIKHVN